MIEPRPLRRIVEELAAMSTEHIEHILERQLRGEPNELFPRLGREEDPPDIIIEAFTMAPKELSSLKKASASLAVRWSSLPDADVVDQAAAVGELCFLCSRLAVRGSLHAIGNLARRERLGLVKLDGGEDLQNRALRALGGLLTNENPLDREAFRALFEEALHTKAHVAVALVALTRFWPEEKEQWIDVARKYGGRRIERVIARLNLLAAEADTLNA
jgi:hypothetical protein